MSYIPEHVEALIGEGFSDLGASEMSVVTGRTDIHTDSVSVSPVLPYNPQISAFTECTP